jgi:hypothetical protein
VLLWLPLTASPFLLLTLLTPLLVLRSRADRNHRMAEDGDAAMPMEEEPLFDGDVDEGGVGEGGEVRCAGATRVA